MKMLGTFRIALWGVALSPFFLLNNTMAIEKAKYSIVESESPFEIRQYEPQIVAETLVKGDFEEVGNEGFRRLYAYISGSNRKKLSISMTAPVSQEAGSEKITMTAPVNQEKVGEHWQIRFFMPASYTMETLPEPLDPKVRLKQIPALLMAACRYSGTWGKKRYSEKEARLMSWIKDRGFRPDGTPVFARYDPPFMPWFLRRNEVLVPVTRMEETIQKVIPK